MTTLNSHQKKYKKILFIINSGIFLFDHYQRYELNNFKKKNLEVYVLDLSKISLTNLKKKDPRLNNIKFVLIKNYEHWKKIISKFDPKDTIVWKEIIITNLTMLKISYYLNNFNTFRIEIPSGGNVPRIKFWLFSYKNSVKKIIYTIYNLRFLVFHNFRKKFFFFLYFPKNEKIIKVHSFDYNKTLTFQKKLNLQKRRYCVYLESPHPISKGDIKIYRLPEPFSKRKWLKSLNNFFDFIEKELFTKVIIHAHPKNTHYGKKNYYNNRQIIRDRLVELVKNSQFVILLTSTGFIVATIFNKPTVSIISNEIINSNYLRELKSYENFREVTGVKLVNIDNALEKNKFIKLLKINKKKYNLFKKNVFLKEKKKLSNFDIIYNEVFK
jgi:hypothetical protein